MTWKGVLRHDGGAISGTLTNRLGWALAIGGSREGPNRLGLVAALTEEGEEAPPWDPEHDLHLKLLAPGAVLSGHLVRVLNDWSGSLGGPAALRLTGQSSGPGVITLQAEEPA